MKFKILRLGQSAYFDGHQRDNITSKEYEIESCDSPSGFILTNKKLTIKERHFVSIYNVAYALVDDEEQSGQDDVREAKTSLRAESSDAEKSAKKLHGKRSSKN